MSRAADDTDATDGEEIEELPDEEIPRTVHVAEDLDEFLEKQRYKAIFKAKNDAAETLRTHGNPAAFANSPAELSLIRERVSTAIVSYITEIRRILEETEQGRELWQDTRIAEIPLNKATVVSGSVSRVRPTDGLQPVEHTPTTDRFEFTNDNSEYYYVLGGVADYLTLHDTEAEVTYLTEAAGLNRGKTAETVAVDPYPPIPTSREVYQKLTRLLADTGLDIELGEPDADEWEL